MYYRTDDPVADFNRHEEDRARELEQLPTCSQCGWPVQTDFCYVINDEVICERCMENFRQYTTDLI